MTEEVINTRIVADADFSSLIADVHRVTSSLSKLQEQLSNTNKNLASSVAAINRNFADTLRSTGQFSTHFVSLESGVEKFGKSLDTGRLKLRDYFDAYQGHVKTSGGLIRDLARQQVAMQNAILQPLGRNSQGIQQFNVHVPRGLDVIKNKTALASQELKIMNKVIQDGAVQLINWGKNTQWAGRQLTVGLTLPLAAFGKAAADSFAKADQELTRLTKVYGGIAATSAAELKKIRTEVTATAQELAKQYGASFQDTISLAADIAATGKQGNELLASTKETTRLAVLGEVDRQDAMKATLALQTAFKQNTQELSDSINFLNAVENQTSTSLADLIEAIPKAGPVIQGLGGSVKDLALYLTAMREGGISAAEGANALKSGLASLINPTNKAVDQFKGFGIDLLGIVNKNAGNVTGTLLELQSALDKLNPLQKQQAIENLFGKFQFARMNALFENLGKQGSQTLQVLDLMKASTADLANIAGRELAQVTESASGKYRRALESLKADLAGVGEQFLTVGTKLINIIDKALQFFDKLPKPVKTALTFIAGLTALAGPLIMLTGLLANFFGYVVKGAMHMKAFLKGGEGWKYLTPEMLAAEKAGKLVEQTFYSDAKAASILQLALKNLVDEFALLETKAKAGAISVQPAVSTMVGNVVMPGGGRVVDPNNPLSGEYGTRASTHMVPRSGLTEEQKMQQTMFGFVPGAIPVNRKIGNSPQIYMNEELPNVPGLTRVRGASTGVIASEASKWHAMQAALGMQSKQEIELLKKEIATTGTVSKEFMHTFETILPSVTGIVDNAARESALIVAEFRSGKISLDLAKSKIVALNLETEQLLASTTAGLATSMGRTLNPTVVPTLDQPVVDATGKSNMRELFKKGRTRNFINSIAGILGVRTSGAGYNIHTTIPKKYNSGGTVVGGPRSETTDTQYMELNAGDFVLNRRASDNLLGFNNGGIVPAMVTPGEIIVHDPSPDEINVLTAYNNRFALGGRVTARKTNYGEPSAAQVLQGLRKTMEFHNASGYNENIRIGTITSDAAILHGMGMDPQAAIEMATADYDDAIKFATGKDGTFSLSRFTRRRTEQLKLIQKNRNKIGLIKKPIRQVTPAGKGATRDPSFKSFDKGIATIHDLILGSDNFTAGSKSYLSSLGLMAPTGKRTWARGHFQRYGGLDVQALEYLYQTTPLPSEVNTFWARTEGRKYGKDLLSPVSAGRGGADVMIARALQAATKTINPKLRPATARDILEVRNPTGVQKLLQRALTMAYMPRGAMARFAVGGLVGNGKHGYGYPSLFSRSKNPIGQSIRGMTMEQIRDAQKLFNSMTPEQQAALLASRHMGKVKNTSIDIGMPGSGKSQGIAEQIAARVSSSRFRHLSPINYGHLIKETSGHSFPIKGVGGIYKDPNGDGYVFVKPMMDETAALAELRATEIARRAHGLKSPKQTIRIMKDPTDIKGTRTFIALQSPYDPNMSAGGTGFTKRDFFKQLVASLVRGDKDLSSSNIFGPHVADVGTAGVFSRASGKRSYSFNMPSMADQATINLLGVKGGAKRAFAENTASIAKGMTPDAYHAAIINEINTTLPKLRDVIRTFKLSSVERKVYERMVKRLEDGLLVDWRPYQKMHAGVQPKKLALGGLVRGGTSNYGRKNKSMAAAQTAQQAEFEAQNRGSGKLFGIGMAASLAGSMMPAGTGQNITMAFGQAASFAAMIPQISKLAGVATKSLNIFKTLGTVIRSAATGLKAFALANPGLLATTSALTALFLIWKKIKADAQRKQENETAMFGLSKKGAQELGIRYTNLTDQMKSIREEQRLMADKAKANFESYSSAGVTGLSLTIEQLRELKKQVKTSMPDMLKTLNNLDSNQVTQWAANIKAQMVASGKSVEEVNNTIYALIESSNKAGMGVSTLTDKMFSSIQDKGSAAAFTMKTLADNFDKVLTIDSKAFASNLDTAVSSMDSVLNSLMQIKDANGKTLTEAEALDSVYSNMEKTGVKNKKLSEDVLATIQKERPELAAILKSGETIGGMYAKWRLYLQGVKVDLASISSQEAETLSRFTAALDSAGKAALTTGGGVAGLQEAAKALDILRSEYTKANKAAKAADISTTGLSKAQIKAINDEIKAIRKRADEKKKALQDSLNQENTQLELQKLQLDYQAALARGDKDAATQAQISIRQLSKQYEVQKAIEKIDANATKEEEAKQKILDKDAAYKDQIQTAATSAATRAGKIADQIKTVESIGLELARIASNKDLGMDIKTDLSNVLQTIAKSAKTDPKILAAYGKYLQRTETGKKDSQGNPIYDYKKDAKGNYVPLAVTQQGRGELLPGAAQDVLGTLASSMSDYATKITGGTTLKQIADILLKGKPTPSGSSAIKVTSTSTYNGPGRTTTTNYVSPMDLYNAGISTELGTKFKDKSGVSWKISGAASASTGYQLPVARAKYGVIGGRGSVLAGENGPEIVDFGSRTIVPAGITSQLMQSLPNAGPSYNIPSNSITGIKGGANNSYNNNVYNIDIALNGTNVTADDVMRKFKAELALVNAREGRVRTVGGSV